jgi:hypothetical protein
MFLQISIKPMLHEARLVIAPGAFDTTLTPPHSSEGVLYRSGAVLPG